MLGIRRQVASQRHDLTGGAHRDTGFRWRVALRCVVAVAAGGASLISASVANAADGTILRTVTASNYSCGVGTGIGFDGTNLLLSCNDNNVITAVSPTDGAFAKSYTISGITSIGAIAWDEARNRLWACGGFSGDDHAVYLIDLTTSTAALKFTGGPGCPDGLAYDGTDDTLWLSPDVSPTVYHYTITGQPIANFPANLGSCGNSGIAIGGPYLFLANNGCSQIYRSTPADPAATTLFGTYPARLEDMECDDLTFKPSGKAAIWSKDAYDGILNAFELNPGDCGFGGQPPSTTRWLALGDSYSAGVGGGDVPDDAKCRRETAASYVGQTEKLASDAKRTLDVTHRACIGAVTADIVSRAQPGKAPKKQLDYVQEFKPDVISLTIGGNDLGFPGIAAQCAFSAVMPILGCPVDPDRIFLSDATRNERKGWDGLYDRLVNTYVQLRKAQGANGDLYALTYPTIFPSQLDLAAQYLIPFNTCNGFDARDRRRGNVLSTRLGDTIFQAVQEANRQVGNVHFVDWRDKVVVETEREWFFRTREVRVAYNAEGLCSKSKTPDINGIMLPIAPYAVDDSFHPTKHGYEQAAGVLWSQLKTRSP